MVKTRKQSSKVEQAAKDTQQISEDEDNEIQNQAQACQKKMKKISNNRRKKANKKNNKDCENVCLEQCGQSTSRIDVQNLSEKNEKSINKINKRTQKVEILEECPICLIEFKKSSHIFQCNTCKKDYHSDCLSSWFSQKEVCICPTCNCFPFK